MEEILTSLLSQIVDFFTKWTTLAIFFAAFLIIFFERLFPYNKGQRILREGFWNDLIMYSVVQNYILGYIIFQFIGWIDSTAHISRLQILADVPIWLQIFIFLITHDL